MSQVTSEFHKIYTEREVCLHHSTECIIFCFLCLCRKLYPPRERKHFFWQGNLFIWIGLSAFNSTDGRVSRERVCRAAPLCPHKYTKHTHTHAIVARSAAGRALFHSDLSWELIRIARDDGVVGEERRRRLPPPQQQQQPLFYENSSGVFSIGGQRAVPRRRRCSLRFCSPKTIVQICKHVLHFHLNM